jgi:hypothetical protein
VRRICAARWSSQSCRTVPRTYTSPAGTKSKKLPSMNSIRSHQRLLAPHGLGRSKTIPRRPGRRSSRVTRSEAASSADVDDGFVASPLDGLEAVGAALLALGHRSVEERRAPRGAPRATTR